VSARLRVVPDDHADHADRGDRGDRRERSTEGVVEPDPALYRAGIASARAALRQGVARRHDRELTVGHPGSPDAPIGEES